MHETFQHDIDLGDEFGLGEVPDLATNHRKRCMRDWVRGTLRGRRNEQSRSFLGVLLRPPNEGFSLSESSFIPLNLILRVTDTRLH